MILHLRWPPESEGAELREHFRDPKEVFPQDQLLGTFDQESELPQSATDTGYRTDFMELWLDPQDDSVAYVVFADHTERWPRGQDIACG